VLRLLTIAVCLLAAGGGLALAAGGTSIPGLGRNVPIPSDKAAALHRLASVGTTDATNAPVASPGPAARPIPARILGADVPVPIPPSVLHVRNGWLVSDGRTLVAVYAGAAGSDPSVGRLVIVRQDLATGSQTVRTVDTGTTGALAITAAPLGRTVERSAQRGSLGLRGVGGRVLRLDLSSGRVGGG
jgi:hypothetical protein